VLEALQASGVATAIANSRLLTGGLSAAHLVGFTLIMGGTLVSNLTRGGIMFRHRPLTEVTGSAARGIAVGLVVSAATGLLLFSPRAVAASQNSTFQVKMLLLAAAVVHQFATLTWQDRRPAAGAWRKASGAIGLILWVGVALAGCAYILLE
jgi:hypothetical protein